MEETPRRATTRMSRGFTLLELVIAMSILAVVLSTLFVSYAGTFRMLRETESQSDIYEMAGAAASRIVEDLESAVSPAPVTPSGEGDSNLSPALFRGERKEAGGARADKLLFRTSARPPFSGEGPEEPETDVRYEVYETREGAGLTLYRRGSPVLARDIPGGRPAAAGWPVCDRLAGVRFSYVDDEGNLLDRWDSAEEAFAGRLPSLVFVELEFLNPSAPEAPYTFRTGVCLPMARSVYGQSAQAK